MLFGSYGSYVFCDGAMGTMLQARGLKAGERSDIMTMTSPETVEEVHRLYVEAGSEIIYTNTLGANALSLSASGYSPQDVITAAVTIAKRAAAGSSKVALDIGPTGALLEPVGNLGYERAYELFAEQAIAGWKAGADMAVAETMSDITELKAAIIAIKENSSLPIIATMTFDKTGTTYLGCTPELFAQTANDLGVSAIGLNCSLAPAEMMHTVERLSKATNLPIILKPNAGLPDSETGKYNIDAVEFARQMLELAAVADFEPAANPQMGSKLQAPKRIMLIGGCCGTTPDYIRELRKAFINER